MNVCDLTSACCRQIFHTFRKLFNSLVQVQVEFEMEMEMFFGVFVHISVHNTKWLISFQFISFKCWFSLFSNDKESSFFRFFFCFQKEDNIIWEMCFCFAMDWLFYDELYVYSFSLAMLLIHFYNYFLSIPLFRCAMVATKKITCTNVMEVDICFEFELFGGCYFFLQVFSNDQNNSNYCWRWEFNDGCGSNMSWVSKTDGKT